MRLLLVTLALLIVTAPASARFAECGVTLRLIVASLTPYDAAKTRETLLALKYSAAVAEQISSELPALAREILARRSPPITVYRGLNASLSDYDPHSPHRPGVPRSGNSAGKSDEMWVARDLKLALGYAQNNGLATGIVVQYEIPEFLLRTDKLWQSTGNTQVSIKWMEKGEAPFVERVATLNGRVMPKDTASVHPERFIEAWRPVPKKVAPAVPVPAYNP